MGTIIYLVRHGQSEGNLQDVFLGHGDLSLTDVGIAQAEKTASFLGDIRPDAIYSSDLKRAYETAERTAAVWNMPIVKDTGLREIFAGDWEFRKFDEIRQKYAESFHVWTTDIGNSRCDEGESVLELQKRVVETVTRIARNHEDQTIFLFTHATPIRVFAAHCLEKTPDTLVEVPWASNASVTKAVYSEGKFTLLDYSMDHFMGDLSTRLPKGV